MGFGLELDWIRLVLGNGNCWAGPVCLQTNGPNGCCGIALGKIRLIKKKKQKKKLFPLKFHQMKMNPKILAFGIARNFGRDDEHESLVTPLLLNILSFFIFFIFFEKSVSF